MGVGGSCGSSGITGKHLVMGNGRLGIGSRHRHFLAVGWMATDGSFYCAVVLYNISDYDCLIYARKGMNFNLFCQTLVGLIVLRDYQQTAGIFINAMHNTGTHDTVDTGKAIAAMGQQCID